MGRGYLWLLLLCLQGHTILFKHLFMFKNPATLLSEKTVKKLLHLFILFYEGSYISGSFTKREHEM